LAIELQSAGQFPGAACCPILLPFRATLQFIAVGSRTQFIAMNRAIEANRLKPVIDRVFPFAKAVDACRYYQAGQFFGKIVIKHGWGCAEPSRRGVAFDVRGLSDVGADKSYSRAEFEETRRPGPGRVQHVGKSKRRVSNGYDQ